MKPYYEHAGITIYHGDCREILPNLKFDLICTDPPYGIDLISRSTKERVGMAGDDGDFDPSHLLTLSSRLIIWGANNFSNQLPRGGWLLWDKRCSAQADRLYGASFEMAWTSDIRKFKIYRLLHGGAINADSQKGNNSPRFHPTQKPVDLMRWCLMFWPLEHIVVDPYMGCGTTLKAAKSLGRNAIGIELEERYCEIAAKRLCQEVFSFECGVA